MQPLNPHSNDTSGIGKQAEQANQQLLKIMNSANAFLEELEASNNSISKEIESSSDPDLVRAKYQSPLVITEIPLGNEPSQPVQQTDSTKIVFDVKVGIFPQDFVESSSSDDEDLNPSNQQQDPDDDENSSNPFLIGS